MDAIALGSDAVLPSIVIGVIIASVEWDLGNSQDAGFCPVYKESIGLSIGKRPSNSRQGLLGLLGVSRNKAPHRLARKHLGCT